MANAVVDAREVMLYESVAEAMLSFGNSTRNAFIWQLKQKGIQMTPNQVDLRGIELMLFQFFGDGAHAIVDRICDVFVRNALIRGYFRVEPQIKKYQESFETKAIERFLHGQSSDKRAG